MHLLSSFSAFTDICGSTTSTSLVVTPRLVTCSRIQSFQHLAIHSCLWGLGALEEPNRECAGFLIMSKRPSEWCVHSHGCYKFDNATLGLGLRDQTAHLPVFLHLSTTNLLGPSSVMRSEQAHNKEVLSADTTKNVCRGDFMTALLSTKALSLFLHF